jgi:hypothetical protein
MAGWACPGLPCPLPLRLPLQHYVLAGPWHQRKLAGALAPAQARWGPGTSASSLGPWHQRKLAGALLSRRVQGCLTQRAGGLHGSQSILSPTMPHTAGGVCCPACSCEGQSTLHPQSLLLPCLQL